MTVDGVDNDPPGLPSLLLVEDDRVLAPLLVEVLSDTYVVRHAGSAQDALHASLTGKFAVLVVDRGLPDLDGLELVRRLRVHGLTTPILFLTARGTVADRVDGLDAGAEDYLVKPFEIAELLARLRALLRRHNDDANTLDLGTRRFEVTGRQVLGGPDLITLSPREAALLEQLVRRPTKVFTRAELMHAVFDAADDPGSVDTYVYYLRRKLGRDAVRTVHGIGYRWGTA